MKLAFIGLVLGIFALAGGGGSSSESGSWGGSSGSSSWGSSSRDSSRDDSSSSFSDSSNSIVLTGNAALLVFIAAMIPMVFFFIWALKIQMGGDSDNQKITTKKQRQKASRLAAAGAQDSVWNEADIIKFVQSTFVRYQKSWGQFDMDDIRQFTTTDYARHVYLMLLVMRQMDRRNVVSNIKLRNTTISQFEDSRNNSLDRVTVTVSGSVKDSLVSFTTGKKFYKTKLNFAEYWNLRRVGNEWKLDSIGQLTENMDMLNASIQRFATSNGMFYSPDWGHLLLPEGGWLFRRGFDNTDINNHVIGFWQNNLLIQLYTYSYTPNTEGRNYYIVGQATLPKTYGGIIVERTDMVQRIIAPKGYSQVSTEWGDFNSKYRVFATDKNEAASLEMLNPSFMAWLYDQDIACNLEVFGSNMYFYSDAELDAGNYTKMFEILKRGYEELKR